MKTDRKRAILFISSLIAVPVVIFLYFLRWKTTTIYGDDLIMFTEHTHYKTLSEKINLLVFYKKYRPIHGFMMHILMECFQKNLNAYYLFNVLVQTVNTFVFARLLNLFLKSPLWSLFFSLIIGLSRFALFNMTQLLNGGPLETLAMTFFLLSLHCLVKVMAIKDLSASQQQKNILLSILFANAAMYTHERYVVIFPFIVLVAVLSPAVNALSKKRKFVLSALALASILLNVGIKKYVFSMPFFVGTAGTDMSPSISNMAVFFCRAVLSIFEINSGDGYLTGITFALLPRIDKLVVLLMAGCIVLILLAYLYKIKKEYASTQLPARSRFFLLVFLTIFFGFLLVPAISTVRLEQRWFQASFSIFVLMLVIALSDLRYKSVRVRYALYSGFILLFLGVDANYLNKGGQWIYINRAHGDAVAFSQAMEKGVISPRSDKLYLFEKKKDPAAEDAINWVLGKGYAFEFYQGKSKKILFVDSTDELSNSFPLASLREFGNRDAQVVSLNSRGHREVVDMTKEYLQQITRGNGKHLLITVNDLDNFSATGFYDVENGIRWTNGNASLGFKGDYTIKDSVHMKLSTFMPAVSKAIVPKVLVVDKDGKQYKPVSSGREGDNFTYDFYFGQETTVQRIDILAEQIQSLADSRKLSFPFISLEIVK